jgi:hypothetical protein
MHAMYVQQSALADETSCSLTWCKTWKFADNGIILKDIADLKIHQKRLTFGDYLFI